MSVSSNLRAVLEQPPDWPCFPDLGIGIIGGGGIVQHAHLPAYRKAGYQVHGIAARRREQVEQLGETFGISQRETDYRRLLNDPRIAIIDVAVPGADRVQIARDAAEAGKHLLLQKPLADTFDEAREIVKIAAQCGVLLAVNHNARWAPAYRAAGELIDSGVIGEVFDVVHEMRDSQDSQEFFRNGWYSKQKRYQIIQYAVHHLDLMQFWMKKSPRWVWAQTARKPEQFADGEMQSTIVLSYENEATALIIDRNADWPDSPGFHRFRIEGTKGTIEGEARSNSLTVRCAGSTGEVWQPRLKGQWFPDAFADAMGNLMKAIKGVEHLAVPGEANLEVLRIVEAAYISADLGHRVSLDTFWPAEERSLSGAAAESTY